MVQATAGKRLLNEVTMVVLLFLVLRGLFGGEMP